MSEEQIIKHCSPTLAGLKTANLFTCDCDDPQKLIESVRRVNRRLKGRGPAVVPLRFNKNKALIYVYRPSKLRADLENAEAKKILSDCGYFCKGSGRCISELMRRLKDGESFPHEIGLFLGYPPEDVRGFIENKAENFKCVGTWKVYGNAEAALKLFAKFKKCTELYCRQLAKGKSIERLTVAV